MTRLELLCVALIAVAALICFVGKTHRQQAVLSYSQFLRQVETGQVDEVKIAAGGSGATPATVRLRDGKTSRTVLPADYSVSLAILQDKLVNVVIEDASHNPTGLLLNAMPFFLLLAVWIAILANRQHLRGHRP
jgi:ATP-dependent Zn protease